MNMSFREKSIWVSLVLTLLIFGYYFTRAFRVFSSPDANNRELIGLFIGVVVLMVIVEVVLHIILAIAFKKEAKEGEDERENLIRLKATGISYYVLTLGVWITVLSLLMYSSSLTIVNIMIFFFILAEIVGFSTQLFYYRKGI